MQELCLQKLSCWLATNHNFCMYLDIRKLNQIPEPFRRTVRRTGRAIIPFSTKYPDQIIPGKIYSFMVLFTKCQVNLEPLVLANLKQENRNFIVLWQDCLRGVFKLKYIKYHPLFKKLRFP